MSKNEAAKILSISFDRITQLFITVVAGLVIFFGKETYNDIKQLRNDSELDKQNHSAQTEINKSYDYRITKLENKFP